MPIYEYRCTTCNEKFEEFQSIGATNENLTCPNCGTPRPERLFSAFASSGSTDSFSTGGGGGCSSSGPFT